MRFRFSPRLSPRGTVFQRRIGQHPGVPRGAIPAGPSRYVDTLTAVIRWPREPQHWARFQRLVALPKPGTGDPLADLLHVRVARGGPAWAVEFALEDPRLRPLVLDRYLARHARERAAIVDGILWRMTQVNGAWWHHLWTTVFALPGVGYGVPSVRRVIDRWVARTTSARRFPSTPAMLAARGPHEARRQVASALVDVPDLAPEALARFAANPQLRRWIRGGGPMRHERADRSVWRAALRGRDADLSMVAVASVARARRDPEVRALLLARVERSQDWVARAVARALLGTATAAEWRLLWRRGIRSDVARDPGAVAATLKALGPRARRLVAPRDLGPPLQSPATDLRAAAFVLLATASA